MLPAPISAIFFRAIASALSSSARLLRALSHVPDYGVAELRALDEGGALHQPVEIVGDGLPRGRSVEAPEDRVGRLGPAEEAEHHLAREDHRAGVHLVEI